MTALEKIYAAMEKDGFPGRDAKSVWWYLVDLHEVYVGDNDKHRWYTEFLQVVKLGDTFIGFVNATCEGDNGIWDTGWEFDLNTIVEVKPIQVTVTKYVPVSDAGKDRA